MDSNERYKRAQEVRAADRQAKQAQHVARSRSLQGVPGIDEIPKPIVVDVITMPGPPETPDPDGLVHIDSLKAPLKIRIDNYIEFRPGTVGEVKFYIRRRDTLVNELLSPTLSIPAGTRPPYLYEIPLASLQGREGYYEVLYSVPPLFGGDDVFSFPANLMIDRTPPYNQANPPKIEFPVVEITQEYLDANEFVPLTIPRLWDEPKMNDVFFGLAWVSRADLPEGDDLPPVAIPVGRVPADGVVQVPRQVFLNSGSGERFAIYVLQDLAGNTSWISRYEGINVVLGTMPTPGQLAKPVVPLALDGLIDREDAWLGVTVDIGEYPGWEYDDEFYIHWGDATFRSGTLRTYYPFPLKIGVDWVYLKEQYLAEATSGPVDTTVSYSLVRGRVVKAEDLEIQVNLEAVGPVDPTDPDPNPVNPNLFEPTLISHTSDPFPTQTLTLADAGQPATVNIQVHSALRPGTWITPYYGAESLEPQQLSGQAALQFELPWATIEKVGNDQQVPLNYEIRHDSVVNREFSRNQWIKAEVIGITLPAVEIQHTVIIDGKPMVTCESIRRHEGEVGVFAKVPHSEHLQPGTELTLHWQVYEALEGGEVIPGMEHSEPMVVPEGYDSQGLLWFAQPYATLMLPIYVPETRYEAFVACWYSIDLGSQQPESSKLRTAISPSRSAGYTCILPD